MNECKNCILFLYEWIEQFENLDGKTFAKFFFALVEYHKTRDKNITERFCGVEKAYFISLISQMEREGI